MYRYIRVLHHAFQNDTAGTGRSAVHSTGSRVAGPTGTQYSVLSNYCITVHESTLLTVLTDRHVHRSGPAQPGLASNASGCHCLEQLRLNTLRRNSPALVCTLAATVVASHPAETSRSIMDTGNGERQRKLQPPSHRKHPGSEEVRRWVCFSTPGRKNPRVAAASDSDSSSLLCAAQACAQSADRKGVKGG